MKRPTPTYEHVDKMTVKRGWFRNQLWHIEDVLNGRWGYWLACCLKGSIGSGREWAIPQLDFTAHFKGNRPGCTRLGELSTCESGRAIIAQVGGPAEAHRHVIRTFERALDHGCNHLQQLVDWWLWGFGSNRISQRPRLSERGAVIMYHELELHRMIANPADWGAAITGEILAGAKSGTAWFPTPASIVKCMTRMIFGSDDRDSRIMSVNDPCVGTGVFLLEASNYSLDLSGQDIDPLMCSWTEFAGWLFVPWLVYGNKSLIRELRQARSHKTQTLQVAGAKPEAPAASLEQPSLSKPHKPKRASRQGLLFDLEPVM